VDLLHSFSELVLELEQLPIKWNHLIG